MTYHSLAEGPSSFWLSQRAVSRRVEVAVVGAGLVGLSTAYWLRRQGVEVAVFEADAVAGRASGRNAGFLLTGSAEPYLRLREQLGEAAALGFWRRTRENRRLLRQELLDLDPAACQFVAEGSWIAAVDEPRKISELRASGEALVAAGFEVDWVEGEALRRASGSRRLGGALYQAQDGGLDPVRLCRQLIAAGGLDIHQGFRIRGLEAEGDGVRLRSEAGDVLARQAVVAVNAYVPELIPQLAAEVRPVRAQMLATGPGPRSLSGVWYIDDGFQYIRQLPDGRVLLGGCRNVALEEEVGFHETPTSTVQGALEEFLRGFFPDLARQPVERRWAGIMAFSPDGLPRIGEVPHLPAALYAAGLTGHGLSLSFVLGRYLARRLQGEESGPFLPAP